MREEVENPMVREIIEYHEEEVSCEECGDTLTVDDEFIESQGEYFCCGECFFNYHEARFVKGWEIL